MANVGRITVEVRPTVTLESAVACVMMLNLFLDGNEGYDLVCVDRGDGFKWELTDEPKPSLAETLARMPNPGSPSNMTDEKLESIAKATYETIEKMNERMA